MAITSIEHITVDENGVAWVSGANTKVIEIAQDHVCLGLSPAEIHFQHPNLSLAQIHAALAFYYDHRVSLDEEIERRYRKVRAVQETVGSSPLQERLRSMGRLP